MRTTGLIHANPDPIFPIQIQLGLDLDLLQNNSHGLCAISRQTNTGNGIRLKTIVSEPSVPVVLLMCRHAWRCLACGPFVFDDPWAIGPKVIVVQHMLAYSGIWYDMLTAYASMSGAWHLKQYWLGIGLPCNWVPWDPSSYCLNVWLRHIQLNFKADPYNFRSIRTSLNKKWTEQA